jgi:hypothetical protein
VTSNNNLAELRKAEAGHTLEERRALYNVLIGALSFHTDAKVWAQALNTTYGYVKEKNNDTRTA